MDYGSFSIFSTSRNVHSFLKNLDDIPRYATTEQVSNLAVKTLYYFTPKSLDIKNEIMTSAKLLMSEIKNMSSLPDAQKEIAGAINGLNILLKNETNKQKQEQLKKDIDLIIQYSQQINEEFVIKDILKIEPNLKDVVNDPEFRADLQLLQTIYGKRRKIEIKPLVLFAQAWRDKNFRSEFRAFLDMAGKTRTQNLDLLNQDKMVTVDTDNPLNDKIGMLDMAALAVIDDNDFKTSLKPLFDEIFHNRIMVTNTQMHIDGINLVFNADAKDTVSTRVKNRQEAQSKEYQAKLKELQDKVDQLKLEQQKNPNSGREAEIKRLEGEVTTFKKLEGYHPRPMGFLYQKSVWEPVIRATDPIQPVTRIIGFATKEGQKKESVSVLDFAKVLGPNNLDLTIPERELLNNLVREADKALSKDPDLLKKVLKDGDPLPEKILEVLKKFDDSSLIHLSQLTQKQKEELAVEAIAFAFQVNFNFGDDLLKVSP